MAQLPKGGLVRGHDKPIHGSCAIYFPGGITKTLSITNQRHGLFVTKKPKLFDSFASEGFSDDLNMVVRG